MKQLERENELLKKQVEEWIFAYKELKKSYDEIREKFRAIQEIIQPKLQVTEN